MYCQNCGSKNESDSKFCQNCGVKLSNSQQEKKEEKQIANIEYFAISPKRLALFSILTSGIYQVYWFYKNWEAIKKAERQNISPLLRSLFAVFFCHGLFKRVLGSSKSHGYKELYSPGWHAAAYIVLLLFGNILSIDESTNASIVWLVAVSVSFIPLLSVQRAINFNNEKLKEGSSFKQGFSGGEVALIVIGVIWSLLILIGIFLS